LRQRWGDTGAAAILNNAGTLLVFGGTRDGEDLTLFSQLVGERHEKTHVHDSHGRLVSTATQRVAVLPPAQIAQLGSGQVIIIRRGMAAALGRADAVWKRRDVRAVDRQDRRYARRTERQAVWTARRAIWAVRWSAAKTRLEAALTAFAAWIDRTTDGPAGTDGDRRVDPDA